MEQYLKLLRKIKNRGEYRMDRTGTGAYSLFGEQMRFDLLKGFPLVTTKKVHLKSIIHELLWFLSGSTNNNELEKNGVTIWREWAEKETGELGPVYGKQWRRWDKFILNEIVHFGGDIPDRECFIKEPVDQIAELIKGLKTNPYGRRHIVSAWNVADIPSMALPPCHCLFQFFVSSTIQGERSDWLASTGQNPAKSEFKLSCCLTQRSCDFFLGVVYNIASYSLLTMMIADVCGYLPGEFVWNGGDVHLYANHVEQAELQLSRNCLKLPKMRINHRDNIDDFVYEDFQLEGYNCHPAIKADIAV